MIPNKTINTAIITIADLSLVIIGVLFMALVHQKANFQRDLARFGSQPDAGSTGRDNALHDHLQVRTSDGSGDRVVRQELLGIKGSLERVVFVIDKSGSMKHGRKWE